jgi:hypothetical protein
MERQLILLEQDADWRLDEHTREIGRAGVARAREALLAARQRSAEADRAADPARTATAA